jgi:ribosomal protein S18 acetylase RimI-like enzyme
MLPRCSRLSARTGSHHSETSGRRRGAARYRSGVAEPTLNDPALNDPMLARRLLVHEARAQLSLGRELRDLGDGWLLHDPADPEPFWNRLVAPRWPAAPERFDRRLDEVITLFATLNRAAHVRPLPLGNEPADIVDRLLAAGFHRVGADRRMVLVDSAPCLEVVAAWNGRSSDRLALERHPNGAAESGPEWATEAATVLAAAFAVDPLRRVALETDILACASRRGCSILMLRDDGDVVAVARRATIDDGTYLSSIGTRPDRRGRGLGSLVTALAVADALEAGSAFVHLAIELDNEPARRFYQGLGFGVLGGIVPDLLLG